MADTQTFVGLCCWVIKAVRWVCTDCDKFYVSVLWDLPPLSANHPLVYAAQQTLHTDAALSFLITSFIVKDRLPFVWKLFMMLQTLLWYHTIYSQRSKSLESCSNPVKALCSAGVIYASATLGECVLSVPDSLFWKSGRVGGSSSLPLCPAPLHHMDLPLSRRCECIVPAQQAFIVIESAAY